MNDWIDIAHELERSGKPYVLVTVLGARGSTPRDAGTKMLVTGDGSFCTIGGGHLECLRGIDIQALAPVPQSGITPPADVR